MALFHGWSRGLEGGGAKKGSLKGRSGPELVKWIEEQRAKAAAAGRRREAKRLAKKRGGAE